MSTADVTVKMTPDEYRLWREWVDGGHQKKEQSNQILLTTEDGKTVSNPEYVVYGANINSWGISHMMVEHINGHYKYPQWKWFSTEEARQEYIIMNKALFNIKQIADALYDNEDMNGHTAADIVQELRAEANIKLSKQ